MFDFRLVADAVFASYLIRVRPNSAVHPHFLRLFFETPRYWELISENVSGNAQPNCNASKLPSLTLPLPPLAEQGRIAAKVEAVLARVEAARRRLAAAPATIKRFRQAVLAAACSGRLTETFEVPDQPLPQNLRDASEFEWPGRPPMRKSWRWGRLGDIAECRLGKMLDKAKNTGVPTPYLRNINVRWFGFDLSDLAEMAIEPEERETFSVRDGDVLVCEGGEPGRAAVWRGGSNELVFQKAIHRVRLSEFILPEWFLINVKYDAETQHLNELFTGSTIKHLTGVQFDKYPVVIPPLPEQHEIVRRVQQLFALADAAEKRIAAASAAADRIARAVLAKAFCGELVETEAALAAREGRVYEPAERLLECIKSGRAAEPKPSKSKPVRAKTK
jgi:type I restriction enzyme S subunit